MAAWNQKGRDFLFPLLTGLGVGIAFSVEALVLPVQAILLPLFTPIVAVPIATLRVRGGRIAWLGSRYAAASCAAAFATWLSFVVLLTLPPVLTLTLRLPLRIIDTPGILVLATLEGVLAAWFATLLRGWAERESLGAARGWSRWDPRSWGVAAKAGGMLALLGVSGLSWIALLSGQLSWPGPTYRDPYLSGIALGVLALVGLVVFILAGFVGKSQAESAAMRIEYRTPYAAAPPTMVGVQSPPSPPQPHLGQGGLRRPPPPPP